MYQGCIIIKGKRVGGGEMEFQDLSRAQDLQSALVFIVKELGNLVEVVERLRDDVQALRDVVEGRRLRKGKGVVVGYRLSLRELGKEGLEVIKKFLYWVWEFRVEWIDMYNRGEAEGFDLKRMRVYLRGRTIEGLLGRVVEEGYSRREVLKLLSDVGLLLYRVDERGQRQYCIPVRLRVGYGGGKERKGVASRYVINWERVEELTWELRKLLGLDVEERNEEVVSELDKKQEEVQAW